MTTLPARHVITLGLICEGYTNAQIARALLVGEETIKSRVKELLRLFGARNRAHLAAISIRAGIVETPRTGAAERDGRDSAERLVTPTG